MTLFSSRVAHHFMVIKAARFFRQELEKAGLDNLKILAEAGRSIVGTYLNSCSAQEKARIRRDLNALLQMGISADTILTELGRQMPELAPIMEAKEGYKKSEIEKLKQFLRES